MADGSRSWSNAGPDGLTCLTVAVNALAFSDVSEVLYARVPGPLKEAVDAHARANALTLTSAVASLLERGLEAEANAPSIVDLERRCQELRNELVATGAELIETRAEAASLSAQMAMREGAERNLSERLAQPIGACPKCQREVRGYDVLVSGACPQCQQGLSSLLEPRSSLNQTEYLLLIGAIGLLLAMALTQSRKG